MPAELPPLPAVRGWEDPWKTGSLFRPSGMLVGVVACNCAVEITVSGVGELAASEMTRLPVTDTVSTVVDPDSGGGACVWMGLTLAS